MKLFIEYIWSRAYMQSGKGSKPYIDLPYTKLLVKNKITRSPQIKPLILKLLIHFPASIPSASNLFLAGGSIYLALEKGKRSHLRTDNEMGGQILRFL